MTIAAEADFRTGTFCSFGTINSMCSADEPLLKTTSMTRFSTTANSALVSKLPILLRSVVLRLVLSRSFEVDESDGCTSRANFDN